MGNCISTRHKSPSPLASAAEILEIERLVRKERYYRDTEQWSLWRKCYHPDSTQTHINISWFTGQIDEFLQRSRQISGKGIQPLHTVTPVDIQIQNNRATAISTCQIVTRFMYNSTEFDLIANLRLVSCLVYTEGSWVMRSLEGIYLNDCISPVIPPSDKKSSSSGSEGPGSDAIVDAEAGFDFDMSGISDLRGSYKCLIWNIERKGMKARRDLPGIDRPDSVEDLMMRASEWVEKGHWRF